MTTKTIFLIRHPETDWNRQRRYQGRTGRPYSDRGEASVPVLVERMRGCSLDVVAASPTLHAGALAARIATDAETDIETLIDESWCEIDHGAWEGLRHEDVMACFGVDAARRFDDPHFTGHGGESLAAAGARVGRAWSALAAGSGRVVAVVSHATPIRLVLCRCLGLSWSMVWRFRVDHGALTRIDITGTSAVVGAVNCGGVP